jgi:hypothetical protein
MLDTNANILLTGCPGIKPGGVGPPWCGDGCGPCDELG